MGPRVGARGDKAAIESFSLLQDNVLERRRWETREELRLGIVTWIERTYQPEVASVPSDASRRSSLNLSNRRY